MAHASIKDILASLLSCLIAAEAAIPKVSSSQLTARYSVSDDGLRSDQTTNQRGHQIVLPELWLLVSELRTGIYTITTAYYASLGALTFTKAHASKLQLFADFAT